MLLLICESESGDKYQFMADRRPSQEEFDLFVQENYPEEYEDEYNYISIDNIIDIDTIPKIELKK